MVGMTDFITSARWQDVFTVWFVLIDDSYRALETDLGRWRKRGPQPNFTDSEVITVALIIETYFHGNEEMGLSFLRQYHPDLFPKLLANGQFNYRRRLLCRITDLIRRRISLDWDLISATDRLRLLDSAPVPLCTYTRGRENETAGGAEHFGFCSSKGAKYFGVKLCLTTSTNMVVDDWMLSAASHHDSELIGAMLEDVYNMTFLGDGAFNKPTMEDILQRRKIILLVPPRKDSRDPWPPELRALVGKVRRKIETTLSVLQTVFHIEEPRSHSSDGLFSRLATKLLAYTLCFITQPLLTVLSGQVS